MSSGSDTQSRSASSIAARSVRSPLVTGTTVAPSSRMRPTLGAWRSMSIAPMYTVQGSPSRAQAAALATPCCPAPVSATMRLAPRRRASSACPMALLILCAPVCARSSRLSHTFAPQRAERRAAKVSAVGRPTQLRQLRGELRLEVATRAGARARRARAARAPGSASPARSGRRRDRSGRAHRGSGRRSSSASRPRGPAEAAMHHGNPPWQSAARCARRARRADELRDRAGLFTPGRSSTPLDTSTPKGCTADDRRGDVTGVEAAGEYQLRAARERARAPASRSACRCRSRPLRRARARGSGAAAAAPAHAPAAARVRAGRRSAVEIGRIGLQHVGPEHAQHLIHLAPGWGGA